MLSIEPSTPQKPGSFSCSTSVTLPPEELLELEDDELEEEELEEEDELDELEVELLLDELLELPPPQFPELELT